MNACLTYPLISTSQGSLNSCHGYKPLAFSYAKNTPICSSFLHIFLHCKISWRAFFKATRMQISCIFHANYCILPTSNVKPTWKAFVLLLLFQKRSNIFILETKFWIETKRFLSVLEKFGPKAFVLVDFQIFFGTSKSFVLS